MSTYLNVPFAQKDEAKQLGARWDGLRRQWYVPPGLNLDPFQRWLISDGGTPTVAPLLLQGDADGSGVALSAFLNHVAAAIQTQMPASVWVRAEISQLKVLTGGHLSLELVEHDGAGQLAARVNGFFWASVARRVCTQFRDAAGTDLAAGIKILVRARADLHVARGLRLILEDVDPAFTLGDIQAKLREIRTTLIREGVAKRNQSLPTPVDFTSVAVISPDQAAGLGDFRRDADRLEAFGLCRFRYFTARFQEKDAAASVGAALAAVAAAAKEQAFDAVCLIRGGGAVTDLYWLNDLALARSLCLMPIPVLTGIGHERDSTILDEVAHRAFDTPSKVIGHIGMTIQSNALAAAENYAALVTAAHRLIAQAEKTIADTLALLQSRSAICLARADSALEQQMAALRPSVTGWLANAEWQLEQALMSVHDGFNQSWSASMRGLEGYRSDIQIHSQRLHDLADQEVETWRAHLLQRAAQQLESAGQSVDALGREILGIGPTATLARGYALVRRTDGTVVNSATQAHAQTELELEFHDGTLRVIVPPLKQETSS